jgi:hypothetical protein
MDQAIYNKARVDKYLMILSLPAALKNIDKHNIRSNSYLNLDSLQFSIYGHITPNIIVPAVGASFSGQEIKISSHSRQPYGNNFVKFDIDNEYKNWWVIYKWLNYLNHEKFSHYDYDGLSQKDAEQALQDYSTNFVVYALDEYNNKQIKFTYTGCFPVSLRQIQYDDRNPAIVQAELEFSYSFFEAELV